MSHALQKRRETRSLSVEMRLFLKHCCGPPGGRALPSSDRRGNFKIWFKQPTGRNACVTLHSDFIIHNSLHSKRAPPLERRFITRAGGSGAAAGRKAN